MFAEIFKKKYTESVFVHGQQLVESHLQSKVTEGSSILKKP